MKNMKNKNRNFSIIMWLVLVKRSVPFCSVLSVLPFLSFLSFFLSFLSFFLSYFFSYGFNSIANDIEFILVML